MAMTWYEWIESNQSHAREFTRRIENGAIGNPYNPMIAAHLAYDAGVRAGLELAAQHLTTVIQAQ